MKIVILDGYTENPGDLGWEQIGRFGELTVYDRTPGPEIAPRIGDADVVFTNKTPLGPDTLASCPDLKFICVLATGYNVIDIPATKRLGIVVSNIPGYGTEAVAQHTIGLMLELCLRIGEYSRGVRAGDWSRSEDFCYYAYPLSELSGKKLGVIGYGNIGRAVARIATAFGMDVLANSRNRAPSYPGETRYATKDEIFAEADFISLHCPLTDENKGIIGEGNIARMKDGVRIINTARGPLVDEAALKEALISGKVAGAALDVLAVEPPKDGNILMDAPNCIITPHIAWAPVESRQRLMDIAEQNLRAFAEGRPINVVNG